MKTRRELIGGAIGLSAALATGCALSSCSSDPVKDAMEKNANLVKQVNKETQRLPIGSVIETSIGRWMIIGQRPLLYVDDELNSTVAENKCWLFDYYCVAWPAGNRIVADGCSNYAYFNVSDIENILYVGLINDEDKDYRNWIDSTYDPYKYNPITEDAHSTGVLYTSSPALVEQVVRAKQTTSSQELYGDCLDGGYLCSKLNDTFTETLSPEIQKIAKIQSENSTNS